MKYPAVAMWLVSAAAAVSLAGCATEVGSAEAACAAAAAELTGCTDEQATAVVAACEELGGSEDAAVFAAQEGATACAAPASDGKSDAATSALVATCVTAMYGVKWTVTALSPSPQPLSAVYKAALRPLFGGLVDTARVSYDARLPPKITVRGHQLYVPPAAMTFGSTIFVAPDSVRVNNSAKETLLLHVHELTHVRQAAQLGGFYNFASDYCRDMVATNFDYRSIGPEVDAYAAEEDAEHDLNTCGAFDCR